MPVGLAPDHVAPPHRHDRAERNIAAGLVQMARLDLSRWPAPDIKTPPESGGVVVAGAREGGRL